MFLKPVKAVMTRAVCLAMAATVPAQAVAAPPRSAPERTLSATLAGESSTYKERFLEQYNKIKDPANGYFSPKGVPYHSVETLMVEAPDHGHETTSEAYSYWLWLGAEYGHVTGDWAPFNAARANMEKYIIPSQADQPPNHSSRGRTPPPYPGGGVPPSQYPSPLRSD